MPEIQEAYPRRLRNGSWGMLVPTDTVELGTPVRVVTRSGRSWPAWVGAIDRRTRYGVVVEPAPDCQMCDNAAGVHHVRPPGWLPDDLVFVESHVCGRCVQGYRKALDTVGFKVWQEACNRSVDSGEE